MTFEELKEKYLSGGMSEDDYIKEYNRLIEKESKANNHGESGFKPHENI